MTEREKLIKLYDFFFFIKKDRNTIPLLSKIRLLIIYIISCTALFLSLPYRLFLIPADTLIIKIMFYTSAALFVSATPVFLATRNLYPPQIIIVSGILILAAGEIINLGGFPVWGPLVIFAIIPIFYLILDFRFGVLLPLLIAAGTVIRIAAGGFPEESFFNNYDYRISFTFIIIVSGLLSTATIICIRKVIRSLINLAFTDQITGLPNRSNLEQLLKTKCFANKLTDKYFSLIGIEILNFNNLNNNIGTENCDMVLKEAAKRIISSGSDISGRWSGSVFMISADISEKKSLDFLCSSLLKDLSRVYRINNRNVYVNYAIAVSRFPHEGSTVSQLTGNLISLFDKKSKSPGDILYHDKKSVMKEQYIYRLTEALHKSEFDSEFHMEYQPKICISENRCCSAEALIRWINPELGIVSPGDFIPAAEESGIIRNLTKWIIRKVFSDRAHFKPQDKKFTFAVNLSIHDLKDSTFIHFISRELSLSGCSPPLIEFEVTERFQLDNDPVLLQNIQELTEMGFRIAIDDFGTGYSSLSYLLKMDIHNLKIDKTFVDSISEGADRSSYPIIDAVISMGNSMGIEVTAEGVENEFQLNYLKGKHCTTVQGWYYAKSMRLEKLEEYLITDIK